MDCLVFEDSQKGVQAAKAAGMYCVAVYDEATPKESVSKIADLYVLSLAELLDT